MDIASRARAYSFTRVSPISPIYSTDSAYDKISKFWFTKREAGIDLVLGWYFACYSLYPGAGSAIISFIIPRNLELTKDAPQSPIISSSTRSVRSSVQFSVAAIDSERSWLEKKSDLACFAIKLHTAVESRRDPTYDDWRGEGGRTRNGARASG